MTVLTKPNASGGLATGTIELLEPAAVLRAALRDPGFMCWMRSFIDGLPQTRPQCIACDVEFKGASPPALWLRTVRPGWGSLMSGVCIRCAALPDDELFAIALRQLGGRLVDVANLHRGGRA